MSNRTGTYDAVVTHVRQAPLSNRFTYRTHSWLVDLQDLPRLPRGLRWLARFDSRDHLGNPRESLQSNLTTFLAARGIDVSGGRLLMLANPRALGYVFNPITIHWCHRADGTLAAVVAEVHNTYGDRHAYLLEPTAAGGAAATVDKEMYVSPFNPVAGRYRVTVSAPEAVVAVSVRLDLPGQPAFVATLRARREPDRPVVLAALRTALTPIRVGVLIRRQGIKLWRQGLRIQPRPLHPHEEAVR